MSKYNTYNHVFLNVLKPTAINEYVPLPEFEEKGVSVYLKREDLVFPLASGNKWRKLKYNFKALKTSSATGMLTFGGAYSNHLAAAAALAAQEQIPIVGIVRGEELATKPLNPTLSQCQAKGMQLVFVSRAEYKLKEHGEKARQLVTTKNLLVVPEGGTNKLAVKGCMEILTNDDIRFDVVGCAVGTGGTLAGLAVSAAAHQKVVGFQMVDDATIPDRIRTFVSRDNWELIRHPSYAGYANIDKRLVAFANELIEKTGVLLDPIYTAPMLFQLVQMIKDNTWTFGTNILLIHTGGTQGIAGYNYQYQAQWPES